MTATGLTVFDKTVQKSIEWLKELQEDLHLEKREDAYEAMRAVLYALRDRLPVNETVELGAQLPMVLRGMYYEGWRVEGKPVKMSRQEFFDRIDREMNRSRQGAQKHDPERICQAVFRLLDRTIAQGEMNDVRDNLPEDILSVWGGEKRATQSRTSESNGRDRVPVEEVMERRVKTVTAESPVKTAADLMKQMDIGVLPVQKENRIAGIVTDRDITVRMVAEGKDSSRTPVAEIMTKGVYTCYNDDDARSVSETMEKEKIRRVVVVDHDNKLVGIVSLGDIAVHLGKMAGGEILSKVSTPTKKH